MTPSKGSTAADWQSAAWRKSTRSSPSGDNCVEVAFDGDAVAVRDTKNRDAAMLIFTSDEWQAFIDGVKSGEFEE
jgi:hypothetical protein